MKKLIGFLLLLFLCTNAQAQSKKFRTDSLKVMFYLDARGRMIVRDSLIVLNNVHADKFYGDGANLTGVVGSVSSTTGDLILGADSDDNGSGDARLQVGGSDRLRIYNAGRVYFVDTTLVVGNANNGSSATSLSGIEAQDDTTVQLSSNRIYGGGTGSRYGMILTDDYNDVISFISGKTGTVPNGNAAWPMRFFIAGPGEVARFTTTGRFGLGVSDPAAGFFHVHTGAGTGTNDGIGLTTNVTGSTSSDGFHIFSDALGGVGMMNREASYLTFGTNDNARLHIDQNGHVAISGTSPGTSLALDVVSTDGAFAPPRMTQTQRDALTASNGMMIHNTSTNKFNFRQNGAWDSLSTAAAAFIGDTTEISVFIDTTSTNSGSGNSVDLTRLTIRRTHTYWAMDAANSDTLLFTVPVPEFADSLEYIVLPYRVNASSGAYYLKFAWEFLVDDDPVDNSFTFSNSMEFTAPTASASGDFKSYRKSLAAGSAKSANGRWIDGMIIRVGGNGSDTASGNMDLSTEIMLGWSRKRGY